MTTRRIQTVLDQQQEAHAPTWNRGLPIDSYVQIYPRVSSPEQKKNVSAEMQQDKGFALLCGWQEERIIMETDDLGLSGQLRMEDRPAFVKMLRNIAEGTIKAVIAAQVDRLFRDRWGQEYSKFMEICYTYGVKVITPNPYRSGIDFVYDFSEHWHVDKFRRKCEEAWNYIENHIGRMLAARDELATAGCWACGNLPIGYLVDRREKADGKKNPLYRKFIPYHPHVCVICWLFERYRELAGNANELFQEVRRREYLFPAFDASVDEELVSRFRLKRVLDGAGHMKGYTLASVSGLRSLLSNPAYAGYWVYKGAVVKGNNHKAIVDYGLFIYAYNRLSPTNLDGTANEELIEKRKQYAKKHHPQRPAYLKNLLVSADPKYKIYACSYPLPVKGTKGQKKRVETFYGFFINKPWERYHSKYLITTHDVDSIFIVHFIKRLQEANEFEGYLEHEDKELKEQLRLQQDIERDIRAAESSMARIKEDVKSGRVKNPDLLAALDEQYTNLGIDLARLQELQKKVTKDKSQAQQRRSYKQLMREAGDAWEEVVLPEEIPLMIDTFVKKVVLAPLSPHFYTMSIHWYDPEWGIDESVCYRDGNASIRWTEEEDALLRLHYATASREELMRMLPTRNTIAMATRAQKYELVRER